MATKFSFLLFSFAIWLSGGVDGCEPITGEDIHDAAQLSKQIYNGELAKRQSIPNTSGFRVQDIFTSTLNGEGLKVIVASKAHPKTTIICYRGSFSGDQLKHQIESAIKRKMTLPYTGRMKIMRYPWDALNRLNVMNRITFASDTKYIITGHSLGGAMATLLAMQLHFKFSQFWKGESNSLITFGSPRVGDGQFSRIHDQIIPPHRKLRVVYSRDPVPHIPLLTQGFSHVSTELFITVKTKMKTKWCGWCKCIPCGLYWVPYEYNWEVCPLAHDLFTCSKKFGIGFLAGDHDMGLYVKAADKLVKDGGWKLNQLYSHQCPI